MKISVVSPVYMAESIVEPLTQRIAKAIEPLQCQYEIILVNDSSPDMSWQKIKSCCARNPNIKGISLSRNFGQHQAIAAGLSIAGGDYTVVMDCDLQDSPEAIPALLSKASQGYDIVMASRENRKDGAIRRLASRAFHWMLSKATGTESSHAESNFGIYSRRVVEQYNQMPETDKLLGPQIRHLGYRRAAIAVEHQQRHSGQSAYSPARLARLAAAAIAASSSRPLLISAAIGLASMAASAALAAYSAAAMIAGWPAIPGFSPEAFSIWFVGGMILMSLGITGIYIGKILSQVKGRQPYIIMETANIEQVKI